MAKLANCLNIYASYPVHVHVILAGRRKDFRSFSNAMIFIIFMMMNIVLLTIIMTIIGSSEEVSRDAACYPVNTELTRSSSLTLHYNALDTSHSTLQLHSYSALDTAD